MLTRLAPHLVRPVPFLYPLTHPVWERLYVGSGIALYDAMAATAGQGAGLPRHRHLTRRQAHRLMPSLRSGALIGAIQYYDAQVDDARHTMELARTAGNYGALVASRVAAVGFLRQGERVTGVRVKDKISGREFEVSARQIVNATGSGPTTHRRWSASGASSTSAPPRASTSWSPATASTRAPA